MNLKHFIRVCFAIFVIFTFWEMKVNLAFASPPLCAFNYIANEGGTIEDETDLMLRVMQGYTGREVRAIANPGYVFVDWDDGVKTFGRSDFCTGVSRFFTANFRRVGMPNLFMPTSVGAGASTRLLTMNDRGFVGILDKVGLNLFVYLKSQAEFEVIASKSGLAERHFVEIINLDMNSKQIQLQFTSEPQIFEMKLGDNLNVDLDGDKIADISVKYQDLVVNRVELTLMAIDSSLINNSITNQFSEETVTVDNYVFERDLYLNMTGADVKELQKFLNHQGFMVASIGPGSLGNETEVFGLLTKQALRKFQLNKKIYPALGYFGPITRKVVNDLIE